MARAPRGVGQRCDAARRRGSDLRVRPVRAWGGCASREWLAVDRRLDVRRRALEPLRHERFLQRPFVRFSRPAGIRSKLPRRGVPDRDGQMEPGAVPCRQCPPGWRSTGDHAGRWRTRSRGCLAAGISRRSRARRFSRVWSGLIPRWRTACSTSATRTRCSAWTFVNEEPSRHHLRSWPWLLLCLRSGRSKIHDSSSSARSTTFCRDASRNPSSGSIAWRLFPRMLRRSSGSAGSPCTTSVATTTAASSSSLTGR